MKKNDVKAQIKSNFQTMSFESAVKANKALLPEYINEYGKKSYVSMRSYYAKHQTTEGVAAEPTADVATLEAPVTETAIEVESKVADEFEDNLEAVEPDQPEELKLTTDVCLEKPFSFIGFELNEENVRNLIDSDNSVLKEKCLVREVFEVTGDFQFSHFCEMKVANNGKGWNTWDDTKDGQKSEDWVTSHKNGNMRKSNFCFPVGEKHQLIHYEYIKYALQHYYLDRLASEDGAGMIQKIIINED
jgi:hypothetical protein